MTSNAHSDLRTSVPDGLSGWWTARLRDLVIAAEVLHEAQFGAPWRDGACSRPRHGDAPSATPC